MDLWEIKVEIPPAASDATDLALLELGVDGWSLLEDAVAGRAWVVGIFPSEDEANRRWTELSGRVMGSTLGRALVRLLPDSDWKHSYREHFKAWTFGRLHWVPVWERTTFQLPAGHSVLWLDPGMAFGTGNHETTRLCIERLVEFEASLAGRPLGAEGIRVVDAGCGSGILALSACLLGFRTVSGFDNDPEAIRVSRENAALNGLASQVPFSVAGLPEGLGPGSAEVVLANIQSDILIRYSAELVSSVAPGGFLALSGILPAESATVRSAFEQVAPGWPMQSRVLGEWCDLSLRRPPS